MTPLASSLLAFIPAASLLTLTPGLDTALVLRTAAAEGTRRAMAAGIGICLGCLAWGAVVALGLGMLLKASLLAYTILKYAGAAYLVWMGVQLLFSRRERFDAPPHARRDNWLARGFLTNALNPKVGVFYVSFLPLFVPAGSNVAAVTLLLAAIHASLGLIWFAILLAAIRPLARALERPRMIRALDRATGTIFLLFAARLALSRD
ncbi:MAG TPA: LysE family translocator [Allosphingosinicella sp.]|jgi:threonine/homoserine/homoserine lactone efflux protein